LKGSVVKNWSDLGIDTRGHSHGEIKTTCPQCSPTRKKKSYPCLNVNIDRGMYNCWHCGWSGSIGKGNYMKPYVTGTKNYRKPEFKAQLLTEAGMKYLEERGITPEVAARNQLTMTNKYMPQREEEVPCIAFPFVKNGEIVNVKYRDRNKYFTQESGAEKTWYKYDDTHPPAMRRTSKRNSRTSMSKIRVSSPSRSSFWRLITMYPGGNSRRNLRVALEKKGATGFSGRKIARTPMTYSSSWEGRRYLIA